MRSSAWGRMSKSSMSPESVGWVLSKALIVLASNENVTTHLNPSCSCLQAIEHVEFRFDAHRRSVVGHQSLSRRRGGKEPEMGVGRTGRYAGALFRGWHVAAAFVSFCFPLARARVSFDPARTGSVAIYPATARQPPTPYAGPLPGWFRAAHRLRGQTSQCAGGFTRAAVDRSPST